MTFVKSTLYPGRVRDGWWDRDVVHEKEIVAKIRTAEAKLIIVPELFLKNTSSEISPFLAYLDENWEVVRRFGEKDLINPFEYESPVLIYKLRN